MSEKAANDLLMVRLGQLVVNERYKNGDFKVPIHLALGHEAIAVAVSQTMEPEDQLVLSHRNIHYNLARSGSVKEEIDEYLLKPEGAGGGWLGSMNLSRKSEGVAYASSILGNNLPVASGMALANKTREKESVVIVVTGDGAMEEGAFYESLTFMKTFGLRVIVIVEDNGWSLASRIHERRCEIDLNQLAKAFGIRHDTMEGNDIARYIETLRDIREWTMDKNEPVIVHVLLTTLGHWTMKTEDYPEGKFINYHAGPAKTVNIGDGPVIENSEADPVFVLKSRLDETEFDKLVKNQLQNLSGELP